MATPEDDFRFTQPTTIYIAGKKATVHAEVYRSSQEKKVADLNASPALLRLYSLQFDGEAASQLLNEVELIEIIGRQVFDTEGGKP